MLAKIASCFIALMLSQSLIASVPGQILSFTEAKSILEKSTGTLSEVNNNSDELYDLHELSIFTSNTLLNGLLNLEILSENNSNITELHKAAMQDDSKMVNALILNGADVNAQDKFGATPIHYAAAFNSNPKVISVLVKHGADVNAPLRGLMPTHIAASFNRSPYVAKALIDNGADIDARFEDIAPIHLAAALNREEVIAVFAANGADLEADIQGVTALHIASMVNDDYAIAALLKGGANPNPEVYGITPLHLAAALNDGYAIRTLVNGEADVHAEARGWTPLHFAAAINTDIKVCKELVRNGANPRAEDFLGISPMYISVINKNRKVFLYLLTAKAGQK